MGNRGLRQLSLCQTVRQWSGQDLSSDNLPLKPSFFTISIIYTAQVCTAVALDIMGCQLYHYGKENVILADQEEMLETDGCESESWPQQLPTN